MEGGGGGWRGLEGGGGRWREVERDGGRWRSGRCEFAARLHQPCRQVDLGPCQRILDAVAHPARLSAEDQPSGDAHRNLQAAVGALLLALVGPGGDGVERGDDLEAREHRTLLVVVVLVAGEAEGDEEARALVVRDEARDGAVVPLHRLLDGQGRLLHHVEALDVARLRTEPQHLDGERDGYSHSKYSHSKYSHGKVSHSKYSHRKHSRSMYSHRTFMKTEMSLRCSCSAAPLCPASRRSSTRAGTKQRRKGSRSGPRAMRESRMPGHG